ncbi:putative efflux pump antibiotic resistance protein [Hypoxylon rubiginosum]|uniref:Efflux pump antibiotic resistance protein n=1 Tax=Hypoxylon rubiginosum TaxID=110542 RepID=A0ACB9YRA2_9PEZI|nr:putative efflux pump antibiotic resistance protein [Hypoxylon rubiginosum]
MSWQSPKISPAGNINVRCIAFLMFLVFLEIPIVITALIAITTELKGFESVSWLVASYLLGYTAVIVIFAKFSDLVGRKLMLLVSAAFFVIFSAACGASQTMVQVIIFRAFQGIGGGGCYSLCTIMMMEIVPPEKYTQYVSSINVMSALALLLGPIIGGAIAANTTWRWIFLINVPIGVVAFVMALISIPWRFPYHSQSHPHQSEKRQGISSRATLDRVDLPGTLLLLFATLGLTAGFEEADSLFPWKSAYVISLLTVSGILWIVLLIWERYVTLSNKVREPVLPWRFLVNRQMVGLLCNQFLLGGPTLIGMFILPQRFQLVYGISGLEAGVRLIPSIAGKWKVPLIYIFIIGSCFQITGFAFLSTLPSTLYIPTRMYGFEILAGWGCGMQFSLLSIAIPIVNESRDRAVGMAAGAQFRMIGSTIVLTISTSVFNTYMRGQLSAILGTTDIGALTSLSSSVSSLPIELAEQVKFALSKGYNHQTLVLCISAALQIPAALLLWRNNKKLVV